MRFADLEARIRELELGRGAGRPLMRLMHDLDDSGCWPASASELDTLASWCGTVLSMAECRPCHPDDIDKPMPSPRYLGEVHHLVESARDGDLEARAECVRRLAELRRW